VTHSKKAAVGARRGEILGEKGEAKKRGEFCTSPKEHCLRMNDRNVVLYFDIRPSSGGKMGTQKGEGGVKPSCHHEGYHPKQRRAGHNFVRPRNSEESKERKRVVHRQEGIWKRGRSRESWKGEEASSSQGLGQASKKKPLA